MLLFTHRKSFQCAITIIPFFSDQITEESVTLDPAETAHAVKVLRLKQNDRLNITAGQGIILTCNFESMVSGCLKGKSLIDRS